MTVIQKTIGRLPVNLGDYNPTRAYGKKNRVLLYGCEWESKVNNNTYAPAALNTTTGVITPDTTHWKLISGSYKTWLIDNGYQKMDASNVEDGNHTQHEINEAIVGEIGDNESTNTIKGRITTLEGEVGTGGSVDERIAAEGARHYLKSETYTKSEVNGMITTPDQEYVTVTATDQTTAVTDVLPATGEPDTVYRVGNWDGNQYDATAYSEYAWNESTSQYIHLSTKTQVGEVFDISAYHATGSELAKYADLAAALDSNNGGGVPQSLQKGGMSIKFVQSSDNKYIQARCMAQNFTTDTTQWAIADEGVYVENPEFLYVKTDNESKILWGIQKDGNVYFGVGCPQQVKDYIEKKISSLSLDEYEDIVAFLNDYLGSDTTLKAIIDEINVSKVDKVEGKSLIDAAYADGISQIENPDFAEVYTDADDKILYGVKQDGDFYFGAGIPSQIQEELDNKVDSADIADLIETKVDKEEGKSLIDEEVSESLSAIEDPEGRSEITTDSEGKIISYRDSDGVKHEEVGIKTNHLGLSDKGLTDLEKDLKEHGFSSGQGDWSDEKALHIAEPYCARVNFTGIDDIPQAKFLNVHGIMQFWDMNGNYFKKEVIMNAQGRSSMGHPKKNIAIDICNNNGWDDDDTFSLQIGDWVPQDSFHLKAFYNDPFRCLCPVAYQLNDEILKTRGEHNDYVWKRALLDLDDITPTSTGCETAENAIEGWNTNARCFPMGFPCIVYLNGDFYGIYSWQLKKHRDNYEMSKKKTKHIHLDGIISLGRILNANGDTTKIWWTTDSPEGVEIRNPKPKKKKDGWDLVLLNGEKYDADANGGEIMSPTMIVEGEEIANPNWDSTNESCVKSYEVKQYILNMSKIIPTLADAYNTYNESAKTSEDKTAFKEVFETYFDVDNLIDYLILSDVLANYDGYDKNVQWITYNGVKWYLCAYDLDGVMGNWWELNDRIVSPWTSHMSYAQFQYLPIFYRNELNARYKELRDKGIIDVNYIYSLVENWLKRVGAKETFEKEWGKWPRFIKNDNVHRLYKWLQISISNMDTLYDYNQN